MTGTVAELMVKLSADNTALMHKLGESERATTGFGSRFGRIMGGIGRAGALAFAAVGSAGLAVVGTGLKVAADMEQAQVAFETMLGSAEEAQDFLSDLKDFAAKTPFEFPQLQEAAKKLMAVGTNAEDVIPIMTTLGNATAGMSTGAEGIQRATLALSQMQMKGKVTGEEMMQLAEAGVPAWDALATVLGVDIPQAMEMVSAGAVKPEVLFEALKTGAGDVLGQMNGLMDKQSQTLAGLFSTMKDTVMMGLGDAAAPLAEALKPIIPEFSKQLGALIGSLATAFGPVLGQIATIMAGLMPVLSPVLETIGGALADALKALGPVIPPVAEAFGNIMEALAPFLPVIARVIATVAALAAQFLNQLLPVAQPLIDAMLQPLLDLFVELAPELQQLMPPLAELATALIEILLALTPILPPLTDLIALGVRLAAALTGKVISAFSFVVEALRPVVEWVAKAVGWFLEFLTAAGNLPGKVAKAFGQVRDAIVEAFKAAINFVIGMWNRLDFAIDFTLPDVKFVPGLDGQRIATPDLIPDIPYLAKGGIVTRPTLAMVGEAGPEAVLPLTNGGGMNLLRGGNLDLAVDVRIDRKAFVRDNDYYARVRGL